jgi:AraC-like DNA-binding protein
VADPAPAGLTAPVTDLAVPDLVAGTWVLDGGTVPRALPQPAVDLLVLPNGRCLLTGPETRGRQGPLPEGGPLVGLRLRPSVATSLFGIAADEIPLSGTPLEVAPLPGPPRARLAGALRLMRERAGRWRVDQRVRAVLSAMHAAPGAPVARHAAEVGLSERQLRRRFTVAVGLGPKSYVRVVRLHHALAAARAALVAGERPQWADIAQRTGFYDQPHLLAEFRAAVGVPPNTLLRPFSPSDGEPDLTRSRYGRSGDPRLAP